MTDERLPWFPCEQTKLLAALAQMQPSEGYVYCVMLLRIYECGGACPDDIAAIATRTRFSKRVTADALDRLFKAGRLRRDSDGIHNPVADRVIAKSQSLLEKRKVAGTKAAGARWKKPQGNQMNGYANRNKSHSERMRDPSYARVSVLSSSLTDSESLFKEESIKEVRISEERSSGWDFDEFWRQFPNKVGKGRARGEFENVRKKKHVEFSALMLGVMRYSAKTDDRPWCNPATWLHQERWTDEPAQGGANGRSETLSDRAQRLAERARELESEDVARRETPAF